MAVDIKIGLALRRMEFEMRRPATQEQCAQIVRVLTAAARRIDRDIPMNRQAWFVFESLEEMIRTLTHWNR